MSGKVKPKVGRASNSSQLWKQQKYSKSPGFTAPTAGLEKVTFDYGPGMNPVKFKYNVNQLAEFMANDIKNIVLLLIRQSSHRQIPPLNTLMT